MVSSQYLPVHETLAKAHRNKEVPQKHEKRLNFKTLAIKYASFYDFQITIGTPFICN